MIGWNGEEIHRGNRFAMVAEKGKPTFGWLGISKRSFHPARDRSFRDIEIKHEKLAMDARCTPSRILANHLEDQLSHLLRGLFSSGGLPNLGNQLPIRPEAGPVRADHRFWGEDDERLLPTGPDAPSKYPEESVEGAKARA